MTSRFDRELAERAEQLARLQAEVEANPGRPPAEWADQTDFSFLAAFGVDGLAEFARELDGDLRDASARGTLENLAGNLRAWESTAEICEDRELYAQLTAPVDSGQVVEVFPSVRGTGASGRARQGPLTKPRHDEAALKPEPDPLSSHTADDGLAG